MLPQAFTERMQRLLGDEYPAFLASYEQPKTQGLRINPLKSTPAAVAAGLKIALRPVPWCDGGFYYPDDARPGRHPYHAAGLYYIQEPSAMAAAQALAPQPGERVLDLCAAPGGKSTHLAGLMQNQGLLVSNEINPKRAWALVENIERMGITCALVLNEDPDRLAERFPAYFDRILVDAPCSGEGMFRKLGSCEEWNAGSPGNCAVMQRDILGAAVRMLKPGGWLLYSTCTFAPEENESALTYLLTRHPEMEMAPLPPIPGAARAVPAWAEDPEAAERLGVAKGARLWPHRLEGEGHFMALLRKRDDAPVPAASPPIKGKSSGRDQGKGKGVSPAAPGASVALFDRFAKAYLTGDYAGPFHQYGDGLYQVPPDLPDLAGLRALRAGLYLGEVLKNRFEPSHALALALPKGGARQEHDLVAGSEAVLQYLRGEAIPAAGQSGWTLVTVDGHGLGWAKASDGLLKNHYPKGLRWLGSAGAEM